MKRVVKAEDCDKYKVYLANISNNSWAMFSEMPNRDEYRLYRIYNSSEYAFGLKCSSLKECVSQAMLDGWTIHEFDTFRSAMQYYLEQTK